MPGEIPEYAGNTIGPDKVAMRIIKRSAVFD